MRRLERLKLFIATYSNAVSYRFRDMINALMGKDKTEYGLSLRFISIIGVIAIVGLAILFIGTGVPVPIVIIMMVLLIVISTYLGKLQGLSGSM